MNVNSDTVADWATLVPSHGASDKVLRNLSSTELYLKSAQNSGKDDATLMDTRSRH